MTNKPIEVARTYHETWNGRDADALVASFTKDGIFSNPDTSVFQSCERRSTRRSRKCKWLYLSRQRIQNSREYEIRQPYAWLIRGQLGWEVNFQRGIEAAAEDFTVAL